MILISTKSVVMLESVGGGFIHVPVVARVLALSRVELQTGRNGPRDFPRLPHPHIDEAIPPRSTPAGY
jgi:hypothetical protein